jgi:hypothetical protein
MQKFKLQFNYLIAFVKVKNKNEKGGYSTAFFISEIHAQ